jgi:hypothetical protein
MNRKLLLAWAGMLWCFWSCTPKLILKAPPVSNDVFSLVINPKAPKNWRDSNVVSYQRKNLERLSKQRNHQILNNIAPEKLYRYLSAGYRGSLHPFPVMYYVPSTKKITINSFTEEYHFDLADLDKALAVFKTKLADKGYIDDGRKTDTSRISTVTINGKTVTVYDITPTKVPDKTTKQAFSSAEYSFLRDMRPSGGFCYLSGLSNSKHRHVLMYGSGWRQNARLTMYGHSLAKEYTFDKLEEAFKLYAAYVKLISAQR